MADNPRIEDLRRRVEADPASIAFAALAEEFRRAGSYHEAVETCRTGLERHPSYISARVTLGRALIETGDYAGARAELETVLKAAPENLAAIRAMAEIHEREGHTADRPPTSGAAQPIPVARPALASPHPTVAASVAEWNLPPAPPAAPQAPSPEPPAQPQAPPPLAESVEPAGNGDEAAMVERLQAFLAAIQATRRSDSAAR